EPVHVLPFCPGAAIRQLVRFAGRTETNTLQTTSIGQNRFEIMIEQTICRYGLWIKRCHAVWGRRRKRRKTGRSAFSMKHRRALTKQGGVGHNNPSFRPARAARSGGIFVRTAAFNRRRGAVPGEISPPRFAAFEMTWRTG